MEKVNTYEVERKIGYWRHVLSKIERDMMKMQSERVEVKQRLVHLHNLQTNLELEIPRLESGIKELDIELYVQ
jgi:hypothetical protein